MKKNADIQWQPAKPDYAGLNIAIIGGTGGIGRAFSRYFASKAAQVTIVGQTFRDADVSNISFIKADLNLLREAERVGKELPAEKLDLVIFTNGIFSSPKRQETPEGIERDMAVSYLSRLVIWQEILPRLGVDRSAQTTKPRVFNMGYPGSGQLGTLDDLNSEGKYKAFQAHMNTVAGNEALVLEAPAKYPAVNVYGLNPGFVKTGIRSNFLGDNKIMNAFEWVIDHFIATPEEYAEKIMPLLMSPDLEKCSGISFNNKGEAIYPSKGMTPQHVTNLISSSKRLVERTGIISRKDIPMEKIFTQVKVGRYTLSNRVVMAPMTRSRAQYDGTPGALAAEYYGQRASVGLIVTEGTQPSDDGQGYLTTPGIYTDAHVKGWQKVTDAVHDNGGHIFIQLMHAGRMSHPDNTPHHRQGVAPSAIAPGTGMFTAAGMKDIPIPRALTLEEIKQTVKDFAFAARKAIEAGADGIEIHGANGYLVQQFLSPSSNDRTDSYGGSIENRARFAIEVATAIVEEIDSDRTAIRLSPGIKMWGIDEGEDYPDLYRYLVKELNKLDLAYLHLMHSGNEPLLKDIRQAWTQALILNRPGRPRENIGADLDAGLADLEAYGQMVLANPDFVGRLKTGAAMNPADRNTFFGGTGVGYTDYPRL